jgi:class 3 adenylate cyclase
MTDIGELGIDELRALRTLSRAVDDALEESLRERENLEQTFARLFPIALSLTGAKGIAVTSIDEELSAQTWSAGDLGRTFAGTLLASAGWGVRKVDADTFVSQQLDVVGTKIGAIGMMFEGDCTADGGRLARLLDAIAEELDTVLASVQTAAEKHQLLVTINHFLSNRVFEAGMDQAVRTLCEKVRLPGFLLLYRDAVVSGAMHYRSYRYGQLEYATNGRHWDAVEGAITRYGQSLVNPGDHTARGLLGEQRAVEAVLISGVGDASPLGKIIVWSGSQGLSAYTMDLVRLLASTLSQRLIDYNRERIHLSQFFSPQVIDDLLKDPAYERTWLTPRDEEAGILFADINGFTRICEQVLERPERIGKFVDDWSEEAVRILHRHGGVFDKMVGDCVIGLFGPPFFKSSLPERAAAAITAAIEIQAFTRDKMSLHPEISRLSEILKVPGLGVAIGVNLAPTFCGLFGPNRQYMGFSTGMNQTARLQSLGSFRETLVMESAVKAIAGLKDPRLAALKFGAREETPVKNVAKPLGYHRLLD